MGALLIILVDADRILDIKRLLGVVDVDVLVLLAREHLLATVDVRCCCNSKGINGRRLDDGRCESAYLHIWVVAAAARLLQDLWEQIGLL